MVTALFVVIAVASLVVTRIVVGKIERPLEEAGPMEILQASIVGTAALGAVLGAMRSAAGSKGWPAFLGVAALMVFAREADVWMLLNPKHFGEFGVRYRLDWWINGGVALWLKLAWATVFATIGAAMAVTLANGWRQAIREHRAGNPTIKLLLLSAGMYLVGYAFDDLVGRDQFVPNWVTMTLEESVELVGACLLLATCVPGMRRWLAPGVGETAKTNPQT